MKRAFKRLAALLCAGMMMSVPFPVYAEEKQTEDVLPSGMDIAMLDDKTDFRDTPGSTSFAVFRGGEVLLEKYCGVTDMKNNIPADENSVYEWGSISKTFVWVSVMQLWEQGKLDLDRDIREYLPDGFFRRLSYDDPITMTDLMNHCAGWQETTGRIFEDDENNILPLGRALQEIEPLQVSRPGEITAYSNYGAAVAGYIVECVSGMDYCEYVHKNILDPLGMEHTAAGPVHGDNPWVREQRRKMRSFDKIFNTTLDLGPRLDYIAAYPAGAVTGTLRDLMTYAQALADSDAPLFGSPETQKLMFTGTDFYGISDIPLCAHGFWFEEYGVRVAGHDGATTAGQAVMKIDPVSGTGLVIMTNCTGRNEYIDNVPSYVFGVLSPEKYSFGKAENAEDELVGYYYPARSVRRGMLRFISDMSEISAEDITGIEDIGNGVLMMKRKITDSEGEYEALLIGASGYSHNKAGILRTPSSDLIADRAYIAKLMLFAAYACAAAASVYMLLIRRKLKKHHRYVQFPGAAAVSAGQAAKIISFAVMLAVLAEYVKNHGGIGNAAAAAAGAVQMICAAVCAVSAVISLFSVISRRNGGKNHLYILSFIGNVICINAVIIFEMYRFF